MRENVRERERETKGRRLFGCFYLSLLIVASKAIAHRQYRERESKAIIYDG